MKKKKKMDDIEKKGSSMPRPLLIDGRGEEEEEEKQNEMERGTTSNYLPEELMIESILTRLPARTLAICCCVRKSWYNSILNDSRFSVIHYNQNKNKLSLVFNLLNIPRGNIQRSCWFSVLGPEKAEKTVIRLFCGQSINTIYEPAGFCNGLACVKLTSAPTGRHGAIIIFNPIRGESLFLPYLGPTLREYICLCHGFGFDSSSQVYKAVIVFASKDNTEFLCMVITLGTTSWRKILTSTSGISPFYSLMVTRVSRTLCRQAAFCRGGLYWRTVTKVGIDNDMVEMLLSFDLHTEKIQFIQLPNECTPTAASDERQDLAVNHLLEFKGYPCIARSERIRRSNNDQCGHRCSYMTDVCCCCCYKVNMYILKDKEKQVWTREETFNVQIIDQEGSLSTPLCQYFDASAAVPPTRILVFSDQVLLYWFNGARLIFYNLQEKYLKVVECSRIYRSIFQPKMNEKLKIKRHITDDDNIYCPSMDYQLHAQVENMVSLKTFIPKEAKISTSDCLDELKHLIHNHLEAGWLTSGRNKPTFSVFF